MKDFKKLVAEYKDTMEKLNAVEAAWNDDCENEELEQQFDKMYDKHYAVYIKLAKAISKMISVDDNIAKRMIAEKFETLESIARMIA